MKNGSFFIFAYRLEVKIWNVHLIRAVYVEFCCVPKGVHCSFHSSHKTFFSTGRSKQTLETVET